MTSEKWQQRLPSGLYTYVHTHSYKSSHTCVSTHTCSDNIIIYQISYLLKDIIQIKSTLLQVDLWHWCDVNITYMWVLSSQIVCWTTNIFRYCMSINNTNKRNNIRKGMRKICHQGRRHWHFFFMSPHLLASNKRLGLLLWWQEHSTGFDCPLPKLMLKCHCFSDGIEERNI